MEKRAGDIERLPAQVLREQLVLRERLITEGQIANDFMFFTAVGETIRTTYLPYDCWTEAIIDASV